jgi:hypothetical protein
LGFGDKMADLEKKILEENKRIKSTRAENDGKFKIFKKKFNRFLELKRERNKRFEIEKQEKKQLKEQEDLFLDSCEVEYYDFLDLYDPDAVNEYEYFDEFVDSDLNSLPMMEQGLIPDFDKFFINGESEITCSERFSEIYHTEKGPLVKKTRVYQQSLFKLQEITYIGFLRDEKSGEYKYVRTTRLCSSPIVKVQYKTSVRAKDGKHYDNYETDVVQLSPRPINERPEPQDKIYDSFADEVFKIFMKSAFGEDDFFKTNNEDMEF